MVIGVVGMITLGAYNFNYLFNFNSTLSSPSSSSRSSSPSSSGANPQAEEQELPEPMLVGLHEKNNLKVDSFVAQGLSFPTSMAFVDRGNILVLEKAGKVRLISNGVLQKQPVLTEQVDNTSERGLLGIAVLKENRSSSSPLPSTKQSRLSSQSLSSTAVANNTTTTKVFLYFTESNGGEEPLRNRIYKYDWDSKKHLLLHPKLILDVSALPGPNHDGGKIAIGPDHYLYAVIGNVNAGDSILQNDKRGRGPHDTSVIFRIDPDNGSSAPNNILSSLDNNATSNKILSKYYAYGIRNSFGLAFDPITGKLSDTEDGEATYDEVNLVTPGFNSGWQLVMGPLSRSNVTTQDLVNLPGSHYTDPAFSWLTTIGVTDIEFLKSTKLGSRYANNIFVGDINNGNLYYFELNKTRTGLRFGYNSDYDNNEAALLSDFVADDKAEVSTVTFGKGFGGITDIKTGPDDGFLYILSYFNGSIYRIVPDSDNNYINHGNNDNENLY
ncbi:MAG TPA: PQQ-dependent sugar dehydrogenase [Nitrososphaeraceae archaeon]|nr:PQQ-dependent sugar dehydrogenase [Nitrososphaeraceae archaeon]